MEQIIFYKVISPYEEDITKNCKLTLTEMDANFMAFKDNDVSGATYDAEEKILYIVKNNGEKIGVDLSSISGNTTHEIEYQSPDLELTGSFEDNILTLSIGYSGLSSSTQTIVLSGFTGSSPIDVSGDTNIYHDDTLIGEGKKISPLKVNEALKTGVYGPCLDIVTELPSDPQIGDRYILQGTQSDSGYLYNKEALALIKELIENTNWRIPTKEDWDTLLNYIEAYDDFRNHDGEEDGEYGNIAGGVLKSESYWADVEDRYHFSILPTHTKEGVFEASFWTDTDDKIKVFKDEYYTVEQKTAEEDGYYSIRLVADNPPTMNMLNKTYPILPFKEIQQYWSKINLDYDLGEGYCKLPGIRKNVSSNAIFVYEWNGEQWESTKLNIGDEVSVNKDNTTIRHIVGTTYLAKKSTTTYLVDNIQTNIDMGWY